MTPVMDHPKKRPHICIKMHFLGVYGFFWVKRVKKSPQLKKNVLFRGRAREIIHFFLIGGFFNFFFLYFKKTL